MQKTDISLQKNDIRARFLAKREKVSSEEQKQKSKAVRQWISELPEFRNAHTVLLFFPFRGEADVFSLLEEFPKKTYGLPSFSKTEKMIAKWIETPTLLSPGRYGIPSPLDSAPEIPKIRFDCVFVPAIAVNEKTGYRIGFGKGYYDQFLQNISATKIIPCFERNLLREEECSFEKHDIPADIIVTEKAIYRIENV